MGWVEKKFQALKPQIKVLASGCVKPQCAKGNKLFALVFVSLLDSILNISLQDCCFSHIFILLCDRKAFTFYIYIFLTVCCLFSPHALVCCCFCESPTHPPPTHPSLCLTFPARCRFFFFFFVSAGFDCQIWWRRSLSSASSLGGHYSARLRALVDGACHFTRCGLYVRRSNSATCHIHQSVSGSDQVRLGSSEASTPCIELHLKRRQISTRNFQSTYFLPITTKW